MLERKLSAEEKQEVYDVFYRFGVQMKLKELKPKYTDWLEQREQHIQQDLKNSKYTQDLFKQYKKHLGGVRYFFLIEAQKLLVPKRVRQLLNMRSFSWLTGFIPLYKLSRWLKVDVLVKAILLPKSYKKEIAGLDIAV